MAWRVWDSRCPCARCMVLLLAAARMVAIAETQRLDVDQVSTSSDASETELWAADRLADFLGLPRGDYKAGADQIAVGYGAAVATGMNPAALDTLDDDSFLINTSRVGNHGICVVIASSARSMRGTIHGAFEYLRRVGFDFFAENVTRVPVPLLIELPVLQMRYSPSYLYRDLTMASPGIGSNLDRRHVRTKNCSAVAKANNWTGGLCEGAGIWRPGRMLSAALGLNGHWSFGPVGGFVGPNDPPGFVATAFNLLTPSLDSDASDCAGPGTNEPHPQNTICPAVFRENPHWFTCGQPASPCTSITVNRTYNSQPCWSAPGVKERMTQNILKILRADPTVAMISVSNMDGGVSYSPCPLDMPAAVAENSTGAANFYVVRDIAATIASEFPKTKIEVLAYNGAWEPPKDLVFADNVVVRIAGFNLGSVSLYHPRNAQNLAVTKGWLEHAKTVYVWNEVNNGQILPHGDVLTQALHLKELASLGVAGYFAEGSALPGADMHDLRVFLAGRLTFNASLDIDELVQSFLDEYYGEGEPAQKVGNYIRLMTAAFQTANHSVDFTGRPMDPLEARYLGNGPNSSVFSNHTLLAGASLLNEALAACKVATCSQRVKQDLMHLQYCILVRWDSLQLYAHSSGTSWPLHDTKTAEFKGFAAAYNASGIVSFTETRKYPPRCHGASPCWTPMKMTLQTFHDELFGNSPGSPLNEVDYEQMMRVEHAKRFL